MDLEGVIGGTPLVRLKKLAAGAAEVWVKLEGSNPGGSIKDRAAWRMVRAAEEEGVLRPGSGRTIVEATSGNTGIGLAMIAAARGYRYVNVAPEDISAERRAVLAALGARLVFTPAAGGMVAAREKAAALAEEEGGWWADQFSNPANPLAHYRGSGPEAWRQLGGRVDALVLGVGTGGTLTGMARYLKEQNPRLLTVALEPASHRALRPGPRLGHPFAGIGAGFVPANLDLALVDEVLAVPAEPALELGGRLAREEGLFLGLSSLANVWGAIELARRLGPGRRVLTVSPDSGFKYLSTSPYGG